MKACILCLALLCATALGVASGAGFNEVLIVDAAIPPWTGKEVNLAGTNSSLNIWLSALDRDGRTVSDLDEGDFKVLALMSPKEFYGKNISVSRSSFIPGENLIYDLQIAPDGGASWSEGGYVLLLEVNKGRQIGRVMVPLTLSSIQPEVSVPGNVPGSALGSAPGSAPGNAPGTVPGSAPAGSSPPG